MSAHFLQAEYLLVNSSGWGIEFPAPITKRIELVTHPDNPALKLYESLGFTVESRKENYWGDGEPRLVLAIVRVWLGEKKMVADPISSFSRNRRHIVEANNKIDTPTVVVI